MLIFHYVKYFACSFLAYGKCHPFQSIRPTLQLGRGEYALILTIFFVTMSMESYLLFIEKESEQTRLKAIPRENTTPHLYIL